MKKCITCGKEKEETNFYKNRNQCKSCRSEYNKQYRKDNLEKIKVKQKEHYENNREYNLQRQSNYYKEHKEESKLYYDNNKEKIANYYIDNKDRFLEYQKNYTYNRRKTDLLFRLRTNLSSMMNRVIKSNGYKKKSRTHEILGLDFINFKKYIEKQFEPWMNWENYGLYNGELNYGWDLDHIIPISSATTEEEIIKLNNYTNFQPLCSKVNRDIKRNKI